jgi:hypothetical protein
VTSKDRPTRQKLGKETLELNCTVDQTVLRGIYRIFHQIAAEYTFLSTPHEINHILNHKVSLTKYKKIETMSCIISNHRGITLETNSQMNDGNPTNTRRPNNAF